MIHCFHGLFGKPSMWRNIVDQENSIFYDLYDDFNPDKITLSEEDILMGYSLGGRISLGVAARHKFNFKKIVLISAHPGLSKDQVEDRKIWEAEIISKFKNTPKTKFLEYWNNLSIFSKGEIQLDVSEDNYQKSQKLFQDYLLSDQFNYWNELILNKEKVYYLYGTEDLKYSEIAKTLNLHGVRTIPFKTDHRVYVREKELKSFLNQEVF